MSKSKVWFSDANAAHWGESLVCKAKDLFYMAGLNECITPGDSVAIKIHVGEYNRTRCLRPELVAAIVEEVKAVGGKPFVCDTTTLPYVAWNSRINAALELETAYRHGFTPDALGCPLVIADGFSGDDDARVDMPDGIVLKEAYVAMALATADAMINLAHGKGHTIASFGGAIKNIGIGGQSKRGKFLEHLANWGEPGDSIGWPLNDPSACAGTKCDFHKLCMDGCHAEAITIDEKGFHRDTDKCRLCYCCQVTCLCSGHTSQGFRPDYFPFAQLGMTDAANGVMKTFAPGKVGHMVYAIDIDLFCDCFPWAATPIVPDIGVFASKDIVAIDTAVLDAIDKAPVSPGGANGSADALEEGVDKFEVLVGATPRFQLRAAEKLGMGSMDYEIITHEPAMNLETWAKWQIRPEPAATYLRKIWNKRKHLQEIEPFNRTPFNLDIYKKYGNLPGQSPEEDE